MADEREVDRWESRSVRERRVLDEHAARGARRSPPCARPAIRVFAVSAARARVRVGCGGGEERVMRRQRLVQSERVAMRQRTEHGGQLPFPTLQHLLVLQPHERRRQHPPPPLQRPAAHGRRRPQHIHRLVVLPRAHKDRSVRQLLLPAQPPVDRVEFAPRARLVRWHLPLLRVPRLRQMVDVVALLLLAQVPPARAERQAKVDGGRCPAAVEKR